MELSKVSLGDVADVTKLAGFEFTKHVQYVSDGEIIAIRGLNVKNGTLDLSDIKRISKSASDQLPRSKIYKNNIIITYTGTIGEVALVTEDDKFHLAPNVAVVRPRDIHPYYLYCYMRSSLFRRDFEKFAVGSTQQTVPMKNIRQIEIPTPSQHHQVEVGRIISLFDDKIELNQKMNQTLEDIAKAIFKSWFVDFDPVRAKAEGRPTGLPAEISDLFPDAFEDSEIGEIPAGWNIFKVGERAVRQKVGKLYSNKTVQDNGEIPVLDQSDNGIIGYHSDDTFVSASLRDPVFTFANHTCKMRILFENFGVIQNVIPIKSDIYPTLWFYLRTLGIKKFEEYKGHIPDFMDTALCFPEVPLAIAFEGVVQPIFQRIHFAEKESKVLSQLRDTLLPKLISGELRISDAEKFLEEAGI
jgi:type I restriction enzyme S subunit